MKHLASFRHSQCYIEAWQTIIDTTIKTSGDSEKAPLDICVETLHSIQSCPVLHSLKFDHLIERFLNLKRSECAAVLLQYIGEEERNTFAKVWSF